MSFNDLEQGYGSSGMPRDNRRGGGALSADESQYNTLAQTVGHKIFRVNGNVENIKKHVDRLNTSKDSDKIRTLLHNATEDTRELIKEVNDDITRLTQYPALDSQQSRQRKLEQKKLSKDFQKVLGEFQSVQRKSASKLRESVAKTQAAIEGEQEEADQQFQTQEYEDPQRRMQLQALNNEIEYNESQIAERETEIQGIEQGITELNEIFRDLATLVGEQESGVQSIYGNVLNIAQNTRHAADELTVANRYQKSARKNMCCLLLIVTVVACVLALIVVVAK